MLLVSVCRYYVSIKRIKMFLEVTSQRLPTSPQQWQDDKPKGEGISKTI